MATKSQPKPVQPLTMHQDGDVLTIQIRTDADARKSAKVSSTGKSKILASTGGFAMIGDGIKLNVVATVPTED